MKELTLFNLLSGFRLVMVVLSFSCFSQINTKAQVTNDCKTVLNNLAVNVKDSISIDRGNLKLYNTYKSQFLCLYNFNNDRDTTKLYSDYIKNTYLPFKPLWQVNQKDSLSFLKHSVLKNKKYSFDNLTKKVLEITNSNMDSLFLSISKKMKKTTGYSVKGSWYVCLNEKFCDLCGNGQIMLIDLNFPSVNFEHVKFILPHEFNHQILHAQKSSDSISSKGFGAFINEGLATYVNYIYWDKKYSPAVNLLFSEKQYEWCLTNESKIFEDAEKLYFSDDWQLVAKYLVAGKKVYEEGPSRLGYFVGFRICQKYVEKYGKNSWKDFYKLPYIEIINKLAIKPNKRNCQKI